MKIIGCDFHPSYQQIAMLDQETGEVEEQKLTHADESAERFYRGLEGKVRVGVEASGYTLWFERLLAELGHELWGGDAARIRTSEVRQQKTDARDARLLLQLLLEGRFPKLWVGSLEERDLRQLLVHRLRLVEMRTRIKNQLHYLALNQGVQRKRRLWSQAGRKELESLPLLPWADRRRQDLLRWLGELDQDLHQLSLQVEQQAQARAEAVRLMTYPGVGPQTALAFVLILGPWQRFRRGKQVASYLGLIPREHSSGGRQRLGHISKQGNTLLRWLLGEAAQSAARLDPDLRRLYQRLPHRKNRSIAKVAVARQLAVGLYWMLRTGKTYAELYPAARMRGSPSHSVVEVRTDRLSGRPASLP